MYHIICNRCIVYFTRHPADRKPLSVTILQLNRTTLILPEIAFHAIDSNGNIHRQRGSRGRVLRREQRQASHDTVIFALRDNRAEPMSLSWHLPFEHSRDDVAPHARHAHVEDAPVVAIVAVITITTPPATAATAIVGFQSESRHRGIDRG